MHEHGKRGRTRAVLKWIAKHPSGLPTCVSGESNTFDSREAPAPRFVPIRRASLASRAQAALPDFEIDLVVRPSNSRPKRANYTFLVGIFAHVQLHINRTPTLLVHLNQF